MCHIRSAAARGCSLTGDEDGVEFEALRRVKRHQLHLGHLRRLPTTKLQVMRSSHRSSLDLYEQPYVPEDCQSSVGSYGSTLTSRVCPYGWRHQLHLGHLRRLPTRVVSGATQRAAHYGEHCVERREREERKRERTGSTRPSRCTPPYSELYRGM